MKYIYGSVPPSNIPVNSWFVFTSLFVLAAFCFALQSAPKPLIIPKQNQSKPAYKFWGDPLTSVSVPNATPRYQTFKSWKNADPVW